MNWKDLLYTWFTQYPTPHHLLSKLMLWATRWRFRPWKNWQIRWFIRRYGVNVEEIATADPDAYPYFNQFFIRALKPGARPVAADSQALVSSVDGVVSQFGAISEGTLIQAKGKAFAVSKLLAGDQERATVFTHGSFITTYLAPRHYHRVHMPFTGKLTGMVYVPGRLFSVNPRTVNHVPGIFARNERLICYFDTAIGPMAVILVGAVFVGCIETAWSGTICPGQHKEILEWDYRQPDNAARAPVLTKGQELGRFNMGSTVIVLTASPNLAWQPDLHCGQEIKMGEIVARAEEEALRRPA